MSAEHYLAIDLGASGGRAILGTLDRGALAICELHRFANVPLECDGALCWDLPRLLEEIRTALAKAASAGVPLAGVGVDAWGVDYGLLDRADNLLIAPRHYRDPRTIGLLKPALKRVPREEIYRRTGIQFMEINTLYQLLAEQRDAPQRLAAADRLLFMPDLVNQWLCGVRETDETIASTSQLLDARTRNWSAELCGRLGIPLRILPPVRRAARVLGPLRDELGGPLGLRGVQAICAAGHDTACAVAATPALEDDWAYVSCGTWSLVGVETSAPVLSAAALRENVTNEAGVCGTVRLLKNVTGLWILQECQRVWAERGQDADIEQLLAAAAACPRAACRIDPEDPRFAQPGDMPARIAEYCVETGQAPPATPGAVVRCVLESLAGAIAGVVEVLVRLTGQRVQTVHVVGGGVRNELLMQMVADACGRRVVAGPAEATALGNVLLQALAQGRVASLAELREFAARASRLRTFTPQT